MKYGFFLWVMSRIKYVALLLVAARILTSCGNSESLPQTPQSGTVANAALNIKDAQVYDFGAIVIDGRVDHTFTVENNGLREASQITGNFSTSSFTFKGGSYPGVGGTCQSELLPGASCTVVVSFSPSYYQSIQETMRLLYFNGTVVTATKSPILQGRGIGNLSGQLDSTLALSGKLRMGSGVESGASVVARPDRSIIVAGSSKATGRSSFLVAKFLYDGSKDTRFGDGGTKTISIGIDAYAYSIAVRTDGAIYVGGEATTPSGIRQFAVARLLENGSLDSSFNSNGVLTFSVGSSNSGAKSIAIDSEGNLVVMGYSFIGEVRAIVIARIQKSGSLDLSFGGSGTGFNTVMPATQSSYGNTLLLTPLNQFLVAGYAINGSHYEFALTSFGTDGSLNTSFGVGGTTFFDVGNGVGSQALAAQILNNGRILLAGSVSESSKNMALLRLMPDYSLDVTFGTSGKVVVSFPYDSEVRGIYADSSGQTFATGRIIESNSHVSLAVIKLLSNGALDSSFGVLGKAVFSSGSEDYITSQLAVQSNLKLLVIGTASSSLGDYLSLFRIWP